MGKGAPRGMHLAANPAKHVTLSEKMLLALPASTPASCFFDPQALHDKNLKGDIHDA